jgi:hypothetical protein
MTEQIALRADQIPLPAAPDSSSPRRVELAGLAALLRRAVGLEAAAVTRVRFGPVTVSALVRLPFDVLVGRSVTRPLAPPPAAAISDATASDFAGDVTVSARELLDWLDGPSASFPTPQERAWRGSVPPIAGWHPVEVIPAAAVRDVVAQAAQTLRQTSNPSGGADQGGGGSTRANSATVEALLDSVVLRVSPDGVGPSGAVAETIEIALRPLSAMNRMGFLLDRGQVRVDLSGRWVRLATEYGSAYVERRGLGLTMLR